MQLKISKTLEGLIARSAFNTTKAGITHSLKDFLALELLREEGSLAFQLLSARLRDWELYQIRLRIEREVASAKAKADDRSSEEFYRNFSAELLATSDAPRSVRRGEQFGGEVAVELLGRAVVRLRLGGGDFALDAQTYLVKLPVAEPC